MASLDMKRIEQILQKTWPSMSSDRVKHRYDDRSCLIDEDDGTVKCIGCAQEWTINGINDMGPEEIKFHFGLYDPDVYKIVDDKKAGHYKLEWSRTGGEEQASLSEIFD